MLAVMRFSGVKEAIERREKEREEEEKAQASRRCFSFRSTCRMMKSAMSRYLDLSTGQTKPPQAPKRRRRRQA